MKHKRLLLLLTVLVLASFACGLFGGSGESGVSNSPPSADSSSGGSSDGGGGGSGNYDTEFPLPADVQNFMKLDEDSINYQTSMSLTDIVDFYRNEFAKAGYDERDITTVINDDTFSIVWDGHPSGRAIVVQGVDLGNGSRNVNVRFEDV